MAKSRARRKPAVRESRNDVTLGLYRALKKRVDAGERESKAVRIQLNAALDHWRAATKILGRIERKLLGERIAQLKKGGR